MVCRQIAETVLLVIFNLVTLSTRVIVFNVGRAGRNLVKLSSDGKNKKKKKRERRIRYSQILVIEPIYDILHNALTAFPNLTCNLQ